ncbi:carbohydrate kinase family protein [Flexibacterium corallicola]|uniref:carbohydrate kinase family protein n=1 Tax=Flexibacterium corallicola TaxID=3037259 RepID=UPI00286F7F61|nr:PfkB family carbohydrate kinase [Pseudovibrio sp. M1P-2-3]
MTTTSRPIAVFGAIHADRVAHAFQLIAKDTSTPGKISLCAGGVGTNIALALARLDLSPAIVGCVGDDADGRWISDFLGERGVLTQCIQRIEGARTGSYLALHNPAGDLFAAISDSEITAKVALPTKELWPAPLENSEIWFCETNLEPQLLQIIAEQKGHRKLAADTVSIAKAGRLRPILSQIDCLFTNRHEAAALLETRTEQPTKDMAKALIDLGCKLVSITDGPQALTVAKGSALHSLPVTRRETVDVTGAGDAFIAGFLRAQWQGKPTLDCAYDGLAASSITIEATGAAPATLTVAAMDKRCKELQLKQDNHPQP